MGNLSSYGRRRRRRRSSDADAEKPVVVVANTMRIVDTFPFPTTSDDGVISEEMAGDDFVKPLFPASLVWLSLIMAQVTVLNAKGNSLLFVWLRCC